MSNLDAFQVYKPTGEDALYQLLLQREALSKLVQYPVYVLSEGEECRFQPGIQLFPPPTRAGFHVEVELKFLPTSRLVVAVMDYQPDEPMQGVYDRLAWKLGLPYPDILLLTAQCMVVRPSETGTVYAIRDGDTLVCVCERAKPAAVRRVIGSAFPVT